MTDIEDYLVARAKESLREGDNWEAKSWFLTGSSLRPNCIKIEYERYLMAKEENSLQEACLYFTALFNNVSENDNGRIIFDEMKAIADSVKSNISSKNSLFYRNLFELLTPQLQYKLLLKVSINVVHETVDYCSLLLMILRRFPCKINEHGVKLIEIATRIETSDANPEYLQKLLIFEILPVLLAPQSNLNLNNIQIQDLLQKLLKIYVDQLLNEKKKDSVIISTENIEVKLFKLFVKIGEKIGWDLNIFSQEIENNSLLESVEIIFQRIHKIYIAICPADELPGADGFDAPMDLSAASNSKRGPSLAHCDQNSMQQIFYSTFMLLLFCLNKYTKETSGKFILVEKTSVFKRKQTKKCEIFKQLPENSGKLQQTLVVAIKCIDLISQEYTFKQEMLRIMETIGLNRSTAYLSFLTDSHFYKGTYEDLVKLLQKEDTKKVFKRRVQLVSALVVLGHIQTALEHIISIVETIKDDNVELKQNPQSPERLEGNYIVMSRNGVLTFMVDMIMKCINWDNCIDGKFDDTSIGHLIVLSQWGWPSPTNLALVNKCISSIKSNSIRFCYPIFYEYVFNPDILEEFMALAEDLNFNIELKVTSGNSSSMPSKTSQKTVTRGVNKNSKEEIRSLLVLQMYNSRTEMDEHTLITFILNEIRALVDTRKRNSM